MLQKLVITLISLILFIGCGDNTANTVANESTLEQAVEQVATEESTTKVVYDNSIQELLHLSKEGTIQDVTYICIGDSTRAISEDTQAQLLFDKVALSLDDYHVTSYLQARGNHTLDDFINETISPTWSETVALIPNEGESTIVDISLGVNDFFALNISSTDQFLAATETVKERLLTAINLIKSQKPKTTFFLTSPNPAKEWEQGAQLYQNAYIEVAREEGYLFVNFVDTIMPAYDDAGFSEWYHDEIHFSRYGLEQVADYILLNILPKE